MNKKINFSKENKIKFMVTLSGFFLCVCDNIRNTGTGASWAFTNNLLGVFIFPFIAFRYKLKDFLKLPYYIFTAAVLIAAPFVFKAYAPGTDYDAQVWSGILDFLLYGLLFIRLIYQFLEKRNLRKNKEESKTQIKEKALKIKPLFILIFAFLFFSAISVNQTLWALGFLFMFTSYYLAPLKKEETSLIFEGLMNGIILAFFVIQSHAFLFRPFDTPRYVGFYQNSNNNAFFYNFVYAAFLGKLSIYKKKMTLKGADSLKGLKEHLHSPKLHYIITLIFASSMWCFVLLTMGRISLVGMLAVSLVYVLTEELIVYKKGIKGFLKKGFIMALIFVLMFVPVYSLVRYLPALRHHPIWFGDYREDSVFSWDPIDSEKYVSLEEFLNTLLMRTDYSLEDNPMIKITPLEFNKGVNLAIYNNIEYNSKLERALGIRRYVYAYFLSELNLEGHPELSPTVQISEDFTASHCHNSFLQCAYCYGILSGLLLLTISLLLPVLTLKKIKKAQGNPGEFKPEYMFLLSVFVFFFILSLAETLCFTGQMFFTLLFLLSLPFTSPEC